MEEFMKIYSEGGEDAAKKYWENLDQAKKDLLLVQWSELSKQMIDAFDNFKKAIVQVANEMMKSLSPLFLDERYLRKERHRRRYERMMSRRKKHAPDAGDSSR